MTSSSSAVRSVSPAFAIRHASNLIATTPSILRSDLRTLASSARPRILILTAGFGEGHNAAARNLAATADRAHGLGTSLVADLFHEASPRLNAVSRRAYLKVINKAPRLWSGFYGWVDRSRVFPRHLWFLRKEMAVLRRLLRERSPDVVLSAYPVYGFMADRLRAKGERVPPFFNVVTDSISINSLWTRPRCDGWFVPNSETARAVVELGVDAQRVHDTGFPVQPFFAGEAHAFTPPDLTTGHRPRVLLMLNSGTLNADKTAAILLHQTDWELTFAVGRDPDLYNTIARLAAERKHPTTIHRWTDRIPELLCTHNAVVSKAGGATTQEAIAARCPMIVSQIVPGQEEGNYELLRRRGIGRHASSPEAILAALTEAFANKGALCTEWRRGLGDLARPDAAATICGMALSMAQIPEGKQPEKAPLA